ncbi:MAG: N-acetylmuramoyl-L-alanine amidase [Clostridia bacterium]|nr:N-acetylmuramoyl-L-alanine amidase [Clostridia bacterium]
MIKTIKLSGLLFIFLMIAAVLSAAVFLLFAENYGFLPLFTFTNSEMPLLVIDPGHGGADGGAVSLTGTYESEINLEIALKMAALCQLCGTDFIMTRDSEDISYPESAKSIASKKKYDQKQRVELINSTANAVLISIHQNCYPHASPHGPQSFYSVNDASSNLSVLIQNSMNFSLCPENRRIATPVDKSVYLFKNITCPAALIECGFISNPEESKLLDKDSYRLKIAMALTCAYLQYLDE